LDPYDRWKYHGHVASFLRDSGIEGNLYNSYYMGGFLGYWLAPRLRVFIDGSLRIPPQVMTDYLSLQAKGGGSADFDATDLLDRYDVDAFVGIGFPTPPLPNRPWRFTARHLEGDPDWILAFRSMQSSVYLRRNERNAENIRRIQAYYAALEVPFDPNTGIDVARVVDESLDFALSHGLLPGNFERLVAASHSARLPGPAFSRLASAYLAVGLDERALNADSLLMRGQPMASAPRRRRIGALLRLDRAEEALAEAEQLARLQPGDALSRRLIDAARRYAKLDPAERHASLALLPVLSRPEARRLRDSRAPPTPLANGPTTTEAIQSGSNAVARSAPIQVQ
jgi:hypothetical protein